jgi:hypothetical protein
MRHVGVGGTTSAFELVGQHRFARAPTGHTASNIRLESLHLALSEAPSRNSRAVWRSPAADQGRRCRLLAASACSTKRRIASEREGLSGCCLAQSAIFDLSAAERRTAVTGSWPVGGRPLFFRNTGIDFGINLYYVKSEPMGSSSFPPALTQATEVTHGSG